MFSLLTALIGCSSANAKDAAPSATLPFPTGTVVAFMGSATAVPEGWVLADGSCFDMSKPEARDRFGKLDRVLAGSYGRQSETGFCLPDLRGRFLRGVDAPEKEKIRDPDSGSRDAHRPELKYSGASGRKVGSVQPSAVGHHRHHVEKIGFGGGALTDRYYINEKQLNSNIGVGTETDNGVGTAAETRPVNVYVHWIIKL
jgi:hypothetical protein